MSASSSSSGTVTSVGSKLISQAVRTRRGNNNNNANSTATTSTTRIRPNLDNIPTLAEFVHRRTVVHQYRHFLKAVTNLTGQDKTLAKTEIQSGFRRFQHETDPLAIQMSVKEGQRRLSQVQALVGHTATRASTASSASAAFQDADSWLNTPDQDDPRGRVGTMWPWQQQQQQPSGQSTK